VFEEAFESVQPHGNNLRSESRVGFYAKYPTLEENAWSNVRPSRGSASYTYVAYT
jgi:hypothetical protein